MFDIFEEQTLVSLGNFEFLSKRFEIWSGGKMIKSESVESSILFNTIQNTLPCENGIEVILATPMSDYIIAEKVYFDVSYTSNDRILLAIIPEKSNCDVIESFSAFVNYAPLRTRNNKIFNDNEPHACSLFILNGIPNKVTFAIALSKILIEFYF